VTKLNPASTAQVYSTYLGGSAYNQPLGLAVDGNGNAAVVGRTQATDFPVKGPIGSGTEELVHSLALSPLSLLTEALSTTRVCLAVVVSPISLPRPLRMLLPSMATVTHMSLGRQTPRYFQPRRAH